MHHTEESQDREDLELSLGVAESLLGHINESIREQEGRERLKTISQDLWVGQGYGVPTLLGLIGLMGLKPTGSHRTYPEHGTKETSERGNSDQGQEWKTASSVPLQRCFGPHGRECEITLQDGAFLVW